MRRSLALVLAVAIAAPSCTHEVSRARIIRRGMLTDTGATIELVDWIQTEKSCAGDKVELVVLTVLTLGLFYVFDEVLENKLGKKRCPEEGNRWERTQFFTTAIPDVPRGRHTYPVHRPKQCVFGTGDDCVTDEWHSSETIATPSARGQTYVEMQADRAYHVMFWDRSNGKKRSIDIGDDSWRGIGLPIAVDPTGERVIVKTVENRQHACWLVTRATNAATRFDDCEYARFLDGHAAFVGRRLVDIDSGATYPAQGVRWLGAGLGLVDRDRDHDHVVEVVQRNPWRVLATVAPVGMIEDPNQVTIIGNSAIVTVQPTGDVAIRPLTVAVGRILDIRGDLALVELAQPQLTAATIRLSTGELVVRTPN